MRLKRDDIRTSISCEAFVSTSLGGSNNSKKRRTATTSTNGRFGNSSRRIVHAAKDESQDAGDAGDGGEDDQTRTSDRCHQV